mgnify:CR=1 FL=1
MFVLRSVVCTLLLVGVGGCGVVAPDDDVIRGEGDETYVYGCNIDEEPTIDIDLTEFGFAGCESAVVDEWLYPTVTPKPIPGVLETYAVTLEPGIKLMITEWVDFEERDDDEVWLRLPVISQGSRIPRRLESIQADCENTCVNLAYVPVVSEPECGITYDAVVSRCSNF